MGPFEIIAIALGLGFVFGMIFLFFAVLMFWLDINTERIRIGKES